MIDAAKNPQLTNIPKSQKNDPTRNSYFMLPLLIGLLGLAFHVRNHKRGFFVVFMLFFFLGFMNILNMNQPPIESRERDYALAGAFFAFAMWVGFGVLALYEMYRKSDWKVALENGAVVGASLLIMLITGLTVYSGMGAVVMIIV